MRARKYFVTAEEPCGRCDGASVVYNKAWDSYFSDASAPNDPAEFARAHGPEELPCGNCQGRGTMTRRVELREALAELGLLAEVARA
jgi:hypothetical protein